MRLILISLAMFTAAVALADTSTPLLDPAVALDGRHDGAAVLWGGRVFVRSENAGDHCLEIAALPLRPDDGRPIGRDRMIEGQHFIACGPAGFASAAHPVRSYLTIAGTVRGIEQHIVARRCDYLVDHAGHQDYGSAREPLDHGCKLTLPVVDVADSRSWREDPTPGSMPSPAR